MQELREVKKFYISLIFLSLMLLSVGVLAQNPPPPPPAMDPFLDEEDFDEPPGTFQKPPGQPNRNQFGDVNEPPPPPTPPSSNGPPSGGGLKAGPRRQRFGPPDLKKSRPKEMAEATDKDITDENFPELVNFDFPKAEITDIVKGMSELTGKNFIVDPSVKGQITIMAPTQVTVAEAYKAFLSALAVNRLTVVPAGKFLKVKQARESKQDNLDTYSGAYAPNTDTMITRIVQLKYIQAKEVFNNLNTILQSPNGDFRVYEPTNTVIITDYGSNIERVVKILRQLDIPGFEEQLEVVRVRNARATDLAKILDQIINKGKPGQAAPGGGFTAGIPRFAPLGSSATGGAEPFSLVIPDDRTNSLILVGNTQGIDKIKKLVRKLDLKQSPEDGGGVYVYYVRFGDAEKIEKTLSGVAQASTQAQSQAGAPAGPNPGTQKAAVFGSDVKIVADKTTNSLVVTASKPDYEIVRAILGKLDVPRDQVFIEGVLMEMAVSGTKTWGISYYNLAGDTFAGRLGFAGEVPKVSQVLDPTSDSGGILGFGGGGKVKITIPGGKEETIPSLVGFINFLSSVGNVNILSTPKLMALDNEDAEIEVGAKIPVSATTTVSNGVPTTTAQREPVTTKLKIKPHISPRSNTVRLEVDQQISGLSQNQVQATNLSQNAVTTTTRNAKTNVMIRDGDTLVLGGLMTEEEKISVTKVPLLGDIPIIGWLFKSKIKKTEKSNLLMFLTPKIIRTAVHNGELLSDELKKRVNFVERNAGGEDVHGEFFENMRVKKNGIVQPIEGDK